MMRRRRVLAVETATGEEFKETARFRVENGTSYSTPCIRLRNVKTFEVRYMTMERFTKLFRVDE